ncbi:CoA-transferase family III [Rhizodiscina lignyota]|uniref:CoA-transferase family III n=1 Tax=Rhizodiscina lignyota TaxID=1504668 RepID=A0A9P4I2U3_9PEZI|nr:CoA-transferase family III [Rhizodiscina lignyota]
MSSPYGSGTVVDTSFTPVPQECRRILHELATKTPGFTQDEALLDGVDFVGHDLPCIPGPIKSVAFTAVLHAMAGIIGHEILELRGIKTNKKTSINTDQAGLYLASPCTVSIDGADGPDALKAPNILDLSGGAVNSPLVLRSQAIYPTKTPNVWFQLHGSTNPWPVLATMGVDPHAPVKTGDEGYEIIKNQMIKYTARDLEMIMMEHGFAGSIVYSPEDWLKIRPAQILALHPLINYNKVPLSSGMPAPAFTGTSADDKRPLAGTKVLELARIIAAPACGMTLAAMGAEVVRVQTDKLVDFVPAQLSLMAGKAAYKLDINDEEDKKILMDLMSEADVIIQGYRLRSLERRGFGLDVCLEMAAKRGKGIVYLDENCYGPDGYYAERPGWQQVADACAGSSYVMGKAFGYPEGQGILPSLPISDMSTGIMSAVTILSMVRDRARYGGSWHGTASLAAYNAMTLQPWIGLYQPGIVSKIQDRFDFKVWGSDIHVIELYYAIYYAWKNSGKKSGDLIRNEDLFVHFNNSAFGKDLRILAPIVRYDDKASSPHWTNPPVPFCWHKGPKWGGI